MGWAEETKLRDPYIFIKSDDFFQGIDSGSTQLNRPRAITFNQNDQLLSNGNQNPACTHGRIFRFDDDSLLLIQFMRPKVWQIRFDPSNRSGEDFTDFNT
jgi:hypothetical protein